MPFGAGSVVYFPRSICRPGQEVTLEVDDDIANEWAGFITIEEAGLKSFEAQLLSKINSIYLSISERPIEEFRNELMNQLNDLYIITKDPEGGKQEIKKEKKK